MRMSKITAAVALALAVLAASPLAVSAAGLKANIYMTQNKIPNGLTEKGLLGFVKSHNAKILRESTEEKLEERKFMAEMVVQFSSPPNDAEFHVKFFDIHDGPRKYIEDLPVYIMDKKQKVYLQRVKLPRTRFKPNRRMELVATVKGGEVGSLKFGVEGEEKRNSGVVSF